MGGLVLIMLGTVGEEVVKGQAGPIIARDSAALGEVEVKFAQG